MLAGVVSVGVVAVVTGGVVESSEPLTARTSRIAITITAMIASTASTITICRCASPSGARRGGGAAGSSSCHATSSVSIGSWNGVANQSSSSGRTGRSSRSYRLLTVERLLARQEDVT